MYIERSSIVIKEEMVTLSKKQKININVALENTYCFVYTDGKKKKSIEIIEMSKYLTEEELKDIQNIIDKYKSFLVNFNKTLKLEETPRHFVAVYKIEQQISLTKIKEIKEINEINTKQRK